LPARLAVRLHPSLVERLVRRIVDVFVRDRLRASYPVIIERKARLPSEDDFVTYIRRRLNRSDYSPEDIKAARFVVREAGARKGGLTGRDDDWTTGSK
jgi:hypothetical protein